MSSGSPTTTPGRTGLPRRSPRRLRAAVDLATVETNIVIVDVSSCGWAAGDFVAAALARGVRTYAVGPRGVRLVWHLDVDDAATDHAIDVLTDLLRVGPPTP